MLRQRYFEADVGITGANFLVAETGSVVLVTNEGNAELTQGLPKIHIVVASLEKVVPTLEDACTLLRVLARSATGQEFSTYTTFVTGPKRPADLDGPSRSTWFWSTMAAARSSAPSSRTSCAASAVAPA